MKKVGLIIIVLMTMTSCLKDVRHISPFWSSIIVDNEQINVGATTANIQCDLNIWREQGEGYSDSETTPYVVYGESDNNMHETLIDSLETVYVQNDGTENLEIRTKINVEISGLKPNTTYYYYYMFKNGFDSIWTETNTFKTLLDSMEVTTPTVITLDVTDITSNSAIGWWRLTDNGGANVTQSGICWGAQANPTVNDNHISSGGEMGEQGRMMNNLDANTCYHIRAYAINEVGTSYGEDKTFVTLPIGSDVPIGAINGLFTINGNGDQVYFSQGNLQYQASTNTWRFAENQWNHVGGVDGGGNGYIMGNVYENGAQCDNGLISSTYNGWIDLFSWGTSGYSHRAQCYQPYAMTYGYPYPQDQFFNAYDNPSYNLYDESGKADWGYNAISNGGNTENQWRTPKTEEWEYLFSLRNTVSGIRFAKATIIYTPIVNEMCNGVLLLPDNWDASCYPLNAVNEREADYAENYISLSDWTNIVEANGAVFLPTTGSRWDNTVAYITWQGGYWSSTTIDWTGSYDYSARCLWFVTEDLTPQNGFSKSGGNAVRLVQDANR